MPKLGEKFVFEPSWQEELGIEPSLLKSVEKVNLHMKEKYGVRE